MSPARGWPGPAIRARVGDTPEAGLARVAAALDMAHARCPGYRVTVLLETTAGQGTTLGHRFIVVGRDDKQCRNLQCRYENRDLHGS